MIGSLMSRLGMAEKLSIPQLQQAIQNGTIPAYVGVPLLQQKVQEHKEAQTMAAGAQQAQPTIAQQVMGEAQGVESLPSNLPQAYADGGILNFQSPDQYASGDNYAGGGMVAFAMGGSADDEEDDDSNDEFGESKEDRELFGKLLAGYKASGEGVPAQSRSAGEYRGKTEAHPFGEKIMEAAKKYGLDPNFALKLANIETGGLKNPEKAVSPAGAMGIMQLMPSTAKGLGVSDPFNPDENIAGGVRLAKRLVDKYDGDYKLAAAAYNWGEGNVDKMLKAGRGFESAPKETQKYVASLAEGGIASLAGGGEVKHYATGDYVGFGEEAPYDPNEPSIFSTFGRMIGSPLERMKNQTYGKGFITDTQAQEKEKGKTAFTATPEDWKSFEEGQANWEKAQEKAKADKTSKAAPKDTSGSTGATTSETTKPEPESSDISDFRQYLKDYRKQLGEQREQDRWMALLASGLGMMGGTSPYAATNFGQGAMQGIQSLMASQKAAGADERALMSAQLGLTRAELYDKMRRDTAAQTLASRQGTNAIANEARIGNLINSRTKQIEDSVRNTISKSIDFTTADPATQDRMIATLVAQKKAEDPQLAKWYKDLGLEPLTAAVAPAGTTDYTNKYGLTPSTKK